MSLFSVKSQAKNQIIYPKKVIIEGEFTGLCYSGKITMSFSNDEFQNDRLTILTGKNLHNNICLHDYRIDGLPFDFKMIKINEIANSSEQKIKQYPILGIGDDSYSDLIIPNVAAKQNFTISANFELPAQFTSNKSIKLFFPITCPGILDDEVLICSDFNLLIKFDKQFDNKTVTSNPKGNFDQYSSSYSINHLDQLLKTISINLNLKSNLSFPEKEFATYNGNYCSLTLAPKTLQNEKDFSHEDIIFFVDSSEAMKGKEIEMISECLTIFIKSLPVKCNFNIYNIGKNCNSLFERSLPYNDSNVENAIKYAKSLEAKSQEIDLLTPLTKVLSNTVSFNNHRLFVLTGGYVSNKSEVIDLIQRNTPTTTCNAIGIGYNVDQDLIKRIAKAGNGFYDFVLSGDDMNSTVTNQLSKSLNGLCNFTISVENNPFVEIAPSLSSIEMSPGSPLTLYLRTQNVLNDRLNVVICKGGFFSNQIKVPLRPISSHSNERNSLEYLFNNEKIKELRKMEKTTENISKICDLAMKYGILTPYTCLSCVKKNTNMITNFSNHISPIVLKTMFDKTINVNVNLSDKVEDFRLLIQDKLAIPVNYQRIVFNGNELLDGNTLSSYFIGPLSTIFVVRAPRNKASEFPKRTFVKGKTDDLMSVILEQKANGQWLDIPQYLKQLNSAELNDCIEKVRSSSNGFCMNSKQQSVVATIACLLYLQMFKKEFFEMWSMIYLKAIAWLKSTNPFCDFEDLIQSFLISNVDVSTKSISNVEMEEVALPEDFDVSEDDFLK